VLRAAQVPADSGGGPGAIRDAGAKWGVWCTPAVRIDPESVSSTMVVAADSNGQGYVYLRPAGGWSGTIYPLARLTAGPGVALKSVAMSGLLADGGHSDLQRRGICRRCSHLWMKRRRHTPEQVIRKLREAERLIGEGKTIPEAAKDLGIREQTYHRWRNRYKDSCLTLVWGSPGPLQTNQNQRHPIHPARPTTPQANAIRRHRKRNPRGGDSRVD
jgi:Transposase